MKNFNPDAYPWAACVPEFLVDDFQCSLSFYRQLGFIDMYQRENFAYLDYQGAQLMISQRDGSWETGPMKRPYGRGVNIQISTIDLDALINRLTNSSIFIYEEKREKWRDLGGQKRGFIEFLVQDPDGYLLRFQQRL